MNKRTIDFKIKIGQTFQDDKRDITITDRKYVKDKKGCNWKYYKYKCNGCGFGCGNNWNARDKEYKEDLWIEESHLLGNKQGCSCCQGNQIIVKGINDITTTAPEMVRYFTNIEDAYTHSQSSGDKVEVTCPDCGGERKFEINRLHRFGFYCSRCQDKIPYPEKMVFSILEQLNLDFKTQLTKTTFEWCDKFRYDFYFELNNDRYILETHGLQHYEITKRKNAKTLKEEVENDELKKQLALKNGIKKENYIVIDCRYSTLEYIKNNIIISRLATLFNLSQIDWLKCHEFALSSRVKEACELWNSNPELNVTDVAKIMKLSNSSIYNYLKKGDNISLCSYIPNEKMRNISNCKPVEIFKDDISLGIFSSVGELELKSEELFGVKLDCGNISKVCNGERKHHQGYTFKYKTN